MDKSLEGKVAAGATVYVTGRTARSQRSRPDAWRYVVEVQDAGKLANITGYR